MSDADGVEVRPAAAADEPDIRRLVGVTPMPGAVAVRFAREPDYFLGTTIMGDPCDVLVGRAADGRLAGIACRAERRAYVNGVETRIGYIGQIRLADGFRGRWLLHQGMSAFRALSPPGMLYAGVVARENPRARGVLLGDRSPGGLRSVRLAGLTTCAILLRPRRPARAAGVELTTAAETGLDPVVAFLRTEGPRRQLFPAYDVADFTGGATMRGLSAGDITVATRSGSVVGVMAAWDQAAYKQDIVDAYGPSLRRLRPAWDVAARLIGAQPLTPPGAAIALAFAACTCVAGDDPDVMRALLGAATARARAMGKAFLMLGLADDDPLLRVARPWLHVTYHSDLFLLAWDVDPTAAVDGRLPYIEVATL
ncbi:MAG: hypothetical protein A2V85_13545 [Chloroflexi bacterium RBG_16_72_14]|nr:MAG: hypothetical protein A2V85_13545 [Chloroflexi bacterium RBG_16_72_14]